MINWIYYTWLRHPRDTHREGGRKALTNKIKQTLKRWWWRWRWTTRIFFGHFSKWPYSRWFLSFNGFYFIIFTLSRRWFIYTEEEEKHFDERSELIESTCGCWCWLLLMLEKNKWCWGIMILCCYSCWWGTTFIITSITVWSRTFIIIGSTKKNKLNCFIKIQSNLFLGDQVILFSFFNRLRALANQVDTCVNVIFVIIAK